MLRREAKIWRRPHEMHAEHDPFVRAFTLLLLGGIPLLVLLALLIACAPAARVVERVITVPVKERCHAPPPLLSPVLGPTCRDGKCCRTKEEEIRLVENVELLLRWMREVEALCAGRTNGS